MANGEWVVNYSIRAAGFDPAKLRVIAFRGHEAISELYHFDVDLVHENPPLEADQFLGQNATLTLTGAAGERHVHGIVSHFEYTGRSSGLHTYRARIVPKLWLMRHHRRSRIFQAKSVPDILAEVLTGLDTDVRLAGSFQPREYCVQYRETDFDFASRLMEEEGIFYFFEHAEDKHTMVLANSPSGINPLPDDDTLPYREPGMGMGEREQVTQLRQLGRLRPGRFMHTDFDFKKPTLDLKTSKDGEVNTELEIYDHPGRFEKVEDGNRLAEIRLQERVAVRTVVSGESDCLRMVPGFKFTLEDHPVPAINTGYLLLRVIQSGDQPQAAGEDASPEGEQNVYHNDFELIPSAVPYRPERLTPQPKVEGTQTAIVTGPGGEEIHTDEFGRIKVQFHWDREGQRNEQSSCWIRVASGWAHAGWGMVTIPRIGMEVVVSFVDGDPDRPLIIGCVYNGANPPPYGLPGDKTKSTLKSNTSPGGGGSNEIRLEDTSGSEEIFVHGQKDWNIIIENDKNQLVGHDETLEVKNNRTKTVGVDQSETVNANKTIQVGGTHTENIDGAKSMTVGGTHTESITGDTSISIAANKTEMILVSATETVGVAKTIMVGAAYTLTVGVKITEVVTGSRSEEVGTDKSETVKGSSLETVNGSKQVTIKTDLTEAITGNHTETTNEEYSLVVMKNIAVEAKGDSVSIKTGKSSIVMTNGGDVTIEAKNIILKGDAITLDAKNDITMTGSNILEN